MVDDANGVMKASVQTIPMLIVFLRVDQLWGFAGSLSPSHPTTLVCSGDVGSRVPGSMSNASLADMIVQFWQNKDELPKRKNEFGDSEMLELKDIFSLEDMFKCRYALR